MKKRGKQKRVESQYVQGFCISCNYRRQNAKGKCKEGKSKGKMRYSLYCSCCSARGINKYPHRQHKKSQCEQCRFIPIHPCQLDVDHIDGNKNNNNINNYITLCANCHRLKTFLNKDWDKRNVI